MQFITNLLTKIDELVWGLPLICLLLGTGIYFTCKLKLLQLTKLKLAFSCIFKKQDNDEGDVSSFQALCTALSSTIGGKIQNTCFSWIIGSDCCNQIIICCSKKLIIN